MNFTRNVKAEITPQSELQQKYPTDLQMYLEVPSDQIDIEEFQELAVERVKLLRVLETVSVRAEKSVSYKDSVIEELSKQNVKYFLPLVRGYADPETRRRDYLSHFILRLAYCKSDEYRRWFLSRELDFFRLKFANMEKKADILMFMKQNDLNYKTISDEEKSSLASELLNSTYKNIVLDMTNVYKVPFTQVVDLVKSRRVLVKGGYAYVPHQDLISILSSIFRAKLSCALSICCANLSSLEGDERLARVLRGLHTSYTGTDYCVKSVKSAVPLGALDALASKSFPLCMRAMHETFTRTHHLRHGARQQYGLFLKGIGVTLEDSLRFWRDGFTKGPTVDADMFEKRYAYNVRYNYGKEGKKADFTPHSCMKIIMGNVGPGENHGCPFRHVDAGHLRARLHGYGVGVSDLSDILDLVSRGHYQLACTRYFEASHNVRSAAGVSHPNAYFEESQALLGGGEKEAKEAKDKDRAPRRSVPRGKAPVDDWGNDSGFDVDSIMCSVEGEQRD